ncbi:MAG: hypothetical protein KJ638_06170 [Chloroflexi bacterium]|nr:hypothetical protein [Chloroflexota bacterium]
MTNHHSSDENMIGYVYRTLDDAKRESIDEHLIDCQICRARLSGHESRQRQIDHELRAAINAAAPSRKMNFAAIAPRLHRSRFQFYWPRISAAVPIPIAIIGLLFSLYGFWQIFSSLSLSALPRQPGALPTLACFCLMFVSMDQFDRSFSIRPRFIISAFLAFILWLSTFFIGLLNIIVVRDLVIFFYIRSGGSPEGASVVTIIAVMIAAMAYIGVVIGGAEYHYKNLGHPSSWKLFTWTIVVQLLIMILPYLAY